MALDLEQTSAVNVCQEDYPLENSLHSTITKNLEMETSLQKAKSTSAVFQLLNYFEKV